MHQGAEIATIEGLGTPEKLHPMQPAFVKCDGYQCGYCTPGQICSAVAMLGEMKAGIPSHATFDLNTPPLWSEVEIRERRSGNLCRISLAPARVQRKGVSSRAAPSRRRMGRLRASADASVVSRL